IRFTPEEVFVLPAHKLARVVDRIRGGRRQRHGEIQRLHCRTGVLESKRVVAGGDATEIVDLRGVGQHLRRRTVELLNQRVDGEIVSRLHSRAPIANAITRAREVQLHVDRGATVDGPIVQLHLIRVEYRRRPGSATAVDRPVDRDGPDVAGRTVVVVTVDGDAVGRTGSCGKTDAA